jgi:sugar phosphate isomerase/epimerase
MNTSRRECFKLLATAPLIVSGAAAAEVPALFRPAICAYSFRNELKSRTMTYADVIRMAADTACDGVDLTSYWLPDTNDETLFALKKLAYRLSVSIYSIGIRARMAQPSPELQAAEVASVRQWIDVALRLGAGHIRVFGGDVPKGGTQAQAIGWAAETLKRCADEAGRKGITLGLEDDGGITTTAETTVEIVRGAGSPWAGITLDVGNFEDDAYRQIEICAPLATNVHFKVARPGGRAPPGRGLAKDSRHSAGSRIQRLSGSGVRTEREPACGGAATHRPHAGGNSHRVMLGIEHQPGGNITDKALCLFRRCYTCSLKEQQANDPCLEIRVSRTLLHAGRSINACRSRVPTRRRFHSVSLLASAGLRHSARSSNTLR